MEPTRAVVLVVEDDPGINDLLCELLADEGYTAERALDGETGLARIEAGGIDLVLLDLMLPRMDGIELCRRMRARESDDVYLPIIMLTALASDDQRHAGFAAGADDYVTKPFKSDELLDRVHVWARTRARLRVAYDRLARERARLATEMDATLTMAREMLRLWQAEAREVEQRA